MQSKMVMIGALISLLLTASVFASHVNYIPLTEKSYYASCEETDDGDDTSKKGEIVLVDSYGEQHKYQDSCVDFYYVREFSCGNKHPATPITRKCALRCVEGACVNSYGKIIERFSNYLRDKPATGKPTISQSAVVKGTPRPSQRAYEVAASEARFLRDSAETECADTDSGFSPTKKGKVTIRYPWNKEILEHEDRCKDWQHVYEYGCETNTPATPRIYRCDFRCVNGECSNEFHNFVTSRYRSRS